jgi:hypothetical protein
VQVQFFADLKNIEVGELLGYLASDAKSRLNIDFNDIASPSIWLNAVEQYIAFKSKFMSKIPDPNNKRLIEVIESGDNIVNLIYLFRKSNGIYQSLLNDYTGAMSEVKDVVNRAIAQQNQMFHERAKKNNHPDRYIPLVKIDCDIMQISDIYRTMSRVSTDVRYDSYQEQYSYLAVVPNPAYDPIDELLTDNARFKSPIRAN